ncbi:MAG TPA: hypothetical protein VK456_08745 [Xanthobacteraceae bacterium]|nr:hypothetical protein [Xanthobacteraceae bacterium]
MGALSGIYVGRTSGPCNRSPDGAERNPGFPHSASTFALRASADLKPAVARAVSEGGSLHAGYELKFDAKDERDAPAHSGVEEIVNDFLILAAVARAEGKCSGRQAAPAF